VIRQKLLLGLPGVAAVMLVLFLQFGNSSAFRQAGSLLFDSYQRIQPREPIPAPVRVIDIDDESIAKIGQWPWPRDEIAALNDALANAGASAIAYDIVFSEFDRTSPKRVFAKLNPNVPSEGNLPDNDKILGSSFAETPVVTGYFLDNSISLGDPANLRNAPNLSKAGVNLSGTMPSESIDIYSGAIWPIQPLLDAAAGNGFVSIQGDGDGIVRSAPMVASLNDQLLASLSAETLRVAQQPGSITLKSSDGSGETAEAEPQIVALKIGQFEAPLTGNGALYMHYREPQPDQSIPAWKILEDRLGEEQSSRLLDGHIVLIGAGAQGLRDLKATPLTASDLGVNVHAQALEQIINGQFLVRPDWALGLERVLLIALGLLMALSLPFTGALRGGLLGLTSLGAIVGGSWYAFSTHQFLLNPIYPFLAIILAYITVTIFTYYREEKQRAYIHGAFDRYLSPELVRRIADNPGQLELGGEEREMTVMFCDIRSFSRISESLSPQEIIRFLIAFLTPMTDILLGRKATIDKYIGDAILAFWNAPLEDEDQHRNAARGALDMVGRLKSLNVEMQNQTLEPWPGEVSIGIGLNSGPCCVGNMGSSQRLSYSLIGDTVNLASRIEGLTKQYGVQIAIGNALAEKLDGFALLEIDKVRVVGRDAPETIFVMLGDEKIANSNKFQELATKHKKMIEAYRRQDWSVTEKSLKELQSFATSHDLTKLYSVYHERLAQFAITPPPADWDGVFEATSK